MVCDIDVYPVDNDHAMIQVQGLECVPFSQQTENDDREVFSNVVWDVAEPDAQLIASHGPATSDQLELRSLLQRTAVFYLRVLERELSVSHPSGVEASYKGLVDFAKHVLSPSSVQESPFLQPEWEQDCVEVLAAACEPFAETIDMRVISELGRNLVSIVQGNASASNIAIRANLVDEWSVDGFEIGKFAAYLARIVKQVVHRYPHMHILEVRSEMGAATKTILHEIGDKFASYTVIVPASRDFDPTQAGTEMYKDKILTKPSDISNDLREQGFSESLYDLIVVSLALHSTPDLRQTLHNLRQLLQPGGQIVVLELSHPLDPYYGVIFGAFPNRRLSGEEGTLSLPITLVEWDRMLRDTAFSGVDTSSLDEGGGIPFSVFVSQAVDDNISLVRDPLSPTPISKLQIQDIVIVGGNNLKPNELTSQLSAVLRPYCHNLRIVSSLPEFLNFEMSPNMVVLSLADLGISIFRELDNGKWEALKKMLLCAGTLIWVSHGRLSNDPYANMMLGLVRGAARDNPALDYLLLDIEAVDITSHRIIAETALRHKLASEWRGENMHLTVENELVLDEGGRLLISRLAMNKEMNDRYNSNHRELRSQIQLSLQNVSISTSESGWDIELKPPPCRLDGENMSLRTIHLLHSPVRVAEFGCMFVVLGAEETSGERFVALSLQNNSLIHSRKELSIVVRVAPSSEARLLRLTANYLLATMVFRGLSKDDKILVYEPSPDFATTIAEEANLLGVHVTFLTTKVELSRVHGPTWRAIHPSTSRQALARLVEEGFSVFVNMTRQSSIESLGDRINSVFPAYCRNENLETLFGRTAWNPTEGHVDEIHSRLARAVAWASATSSNIPEPKEPVPTVTLSSFPKDRDKLDPLTVIDVIRPAEVSVVVQPVDLHVSFSNKKTYWLVGLTGGLGLSLCEWMVQRGARYLVVASRKPTIETSWLDDMRAKGVTVKVSSWSVFELKITTAFRTNFN
jgi:hybrid polyketide synthase/nonribosomal peptide synthetase ACE1